MLRKLVLFCLVFVSLVFVSPVQVSNAAPATATIGDIAAVQSQLNNAAALLRRAGYTIRESGVDTLYLDDTTLYSGTFRRGYTYKVMAIGGRGIADLDIALYDENDNLIDEDSESDARPIVDVTPRWSGDFTLAINLYALTRGARAYDDYAYGYIVAYK